MNIGKLIRLLKAKEEAAWSQYDDTGDSKYAERAGTFNEVIILLSDEYQFDESCAIFEVE